MTHKSPFDEIDKIVDEKVSPVLNDMFKLNLAEEVEHSESGDHGQKDDHGEEEHGTSQNETHDANTD